VIGNQAARGSLRRTIQVRLSRRARLHAADANLSGFIHHSRRSAVLVFAASALHVANIQAQTVRGTLVERETGRPIAYALVRLLAEQGDTAATALSGTNGTFVLTAKTAGGFYLQASALGFLDEKAGIIDLGTGAEMSLQFRLRPRPIEVAGIFSKVDPSKVREGRLMSNGFYDRLVQGFGRFYTPADIEKAHALKPTELLFNIDRVSVGTPDPSVCETPGGSPRPPPQAGERGRPLDCRRPVIQMSSPTGPCFPPVYVDGVLVATDGDLDAAVNMASIEALEIYRGAAEIPLQWGGTMASGCGVVLAWTKQGPP
jgi:hypothetical protein